MNGSPSDTEVARLRTQVWRLRGRRTRAAGTTLVVVGSVLLLLAFFTRYIVFEVVSIVALLLGIIYAFIGAESYVRADVARRVAGSSLLPLQQLLEKFDYREKAVYLPPLGDAKTGMMFIPKVSGLSENLIVKGELDEIRDKGLLVSSTGENLFGAIEEEFSDLRAVDFEFLLEWMPRVLVDGLGLASRAEISRKGDEIDIHLWSNALGPVDMDAGLNRLCSQVGCPVNGAVALALAKNTDRIVSISGCKNLNGGRMTRMMYRLGPKLMRD